jgi:hypothetical protein
LLVLEAPVVHDSTHGWVGASGNFYEVETFLLRSAESFVSGQDAQLLTVLEYYAYLRNTNPVVDTIEFSGSAAVASFGSFFNDAFSGWVFVVLGIALGPKVGGQQWAVAWHGLPRRI